jgi:membrane-bound lytic murein transglycosylase D
VTGPWPILASDLHGATEALASAAVEAKAARAKRTRNYRVRRGDTLIGIVHKLSCSDVKEVAQLNGIKDGHLRAGHTIKVPAC